MRLFLFFVFAGVISIPFSHAEESPISLRVLCYNIHYGQGTDQVYDVERLAAVINKQKPDVVALQEVDVVVNRSGKIHQAQKLAKLTGMDVRFGPTQHYQGGLFGNAVLTRLPILDVEIQPLPYSESTQERTTYPRAAIAVTVGLADDQSLKVISTHFQHNVPEDRVAEAKAINRLFASDNSSTKLCILAGDMNAKPNEEPIQILQTKWKNAMSPTAPPTAPSVNPKSRIDYIFYRENPLLKWKETRVIAEPLASDHLPVVADFAISAKP